MVYQQHNDFCTPRTSTKNTSYENGSVQVHKPDAIEVTEEMNGDRAADKDGAIALTTISDDLRLEVTCGQNQAVLYTGRLQLGSKGTCVLFENAWLTPNEFQYVSGRETAKDWKRSIKHHGKSLKVLIAKGILSTTPPARCNCTQCITSPKKDADTRKLPSDRTAALSPSVIATKLPGVSDAWKVPPVKHSNGLALDSSAFRPPADVGAPPNTTSILSLQYSSNTSTVAGITYSDIEDSASCSERGLIKKPQKRPRSPPGMSEAQSKFLTTSTSQRLIGSTPSLTADESVYNVSRRQFSSVEEFSSHACSLTPLCHEYNSSADSSKSLQLLGRHAVTGKHTTPATCAVSSITSTNQTSQSSVISPSPYLPFFNSMPSSNISGLCYPSPYIMLSAPPLTYQQTPEHFPYGWISSAVSGTEPTGSKVIAEHMQLDSQTQQQLHRGLPTSAAFDFPWMRANTMETTGRLLQKASPDLYDGHLAAATKQSFNPYMLMRNFSSLGATLASDIHRQPSCDLPSSIGGNRLLLDNHPASYFNIYPPLFHTPYLGIPSR